MRVDEGEEDRGEEDKDDAGQNNGEESNARVRLRKKSSKKQEIIFHFSHSLRIPMMRKLEVALGKTLEVALLRKLEVELMMIMMMKNSRGSYRMMNIWLLLLTLMMNGKTVSSIDIPSSLRHLPLARKIDHSSVKRA
ncbi:hypothetical protein F2Q70_00039256 [Brassica cretica]|uniref:Uncharacterized protein n=1 Tax=Brassica cretica TaxID=69181 RepID=A0A8S9KA26_BRACR|nr:hypothetical protein F2Q70_00039256 [Brassica cretica]